MRPEIRHQMIEKVGKGERRSEDGFRHTVGRKLLEQLMLISDPPHGMCRILNIYWDPVNEKAVFKYEDEPVE